MSQRNDDAFAAFMVKLASNMIKREDDQIRLRNEFNEALKTMATSAMSAMQTLSNAGPNPKVQSKAAQAIMQHGRPTKPALPPHRLSGVGNVTADEMEIIRAYFAGEDVIATLLTQER
jgi:hypothetical protein